MPGPDHIQQQQEVQHTLTSLRFSDSDLRELAANLQDPSIVGRISLRAISSTVSKQELREQFPEGRIFACDFPVTDIGQDQAIPGGFYCPKTDIINIDHHSPAERMFRFISSGTLAIEHVVREGCAPHDTHVVINHTDCDSIISSLIMTGGLPPHPEFNAAVIAADHTGDKNTISDLLQALDVQRNIAFSARNLALLLSGQPLEPSAQKLLDARMHGREETRAAIEEGDALLKRGALSVVRVSGNMRNEFMPALLPEAKLIVTYEPGDTADTWITRFRLGKAAPAGFTILALNLSEFDQAYGGRWNAGSNKRGGGTRLPLGEYITNTERSLQAAIAQ